MLPVCLFLLFAAIQTATAPASPQPPNDYSLLQKIKLNVQAELAKSANYTCVQTIERIYYGEKHACVANAPHGKPKEFMRDRLRLDVAVSEGKEIFSLHGENRFASGGISSVISNGPRTSGQFVGFLRNIFFMPGVQFTFKGSSQANGKLVYSFDYVVQLLRSNYYLEGRRGKSIIPFHGGFSADAANFKLVHLNVVADQVPQNSGICSAETDVDYQLVDISGQQSLLPSTFVLKMESEGDLYTVNRNQYAQCREFRGESTLHFTSVEPAESAVVSHVVDDPLPAGLTLKASLDSQIDDKNSYVGDAIQATLIEPLPVPGSKTIIPKGATLHGVISKMEQHSGSGLTYWLVSVKFERLNSGDDSYLLSAWPLPPDYGNTMSHFGADRVLAAETMDAAKRGLWFEDGAHFRLPKRFTRYWRTEQPNRTTPESASGAR